MAILETEKIVMEIGNIISYRYKDDLDIYESFNFNITYDGIKIFNNITRTKFELTGGNIQNLIRMIEKVLNNEVEYNELEFCEPDFEFSLRRFQYAEHFNIVSYEFIVWLMCGQWMPFYSDTGVGCKFSLSSKDLQTFVDDLQFEFDNRKIISYDLEENIE